MTKKEAISLAAQLGMTVSGASDLADQIEAAGLTLALDNQTGDWVIFQGSEPIARIA